MSVKEVLLEAERMLLMPEIDILKPLLTSQLLSEQVNKRILDNGLQLLTLNREELKMLNHTKQQVPHLSNNFLLPNKLNHKEAVNMEELPKLNFLRDSRKEWLQEEPEASLVLRESSRSWMMIIVDILM